MFGWTGTTLRINLSSGAVTRGATDPQMAKQFIGARGLATKIMSMEVVRIIKSSLPPGLLPELTPLRPDVSM